MYEVEVKVPADHETVRDALDELGAERVDSVSQVDTYFNAPHRDFAETDEALRVRATGTPPENGTVDELPETPDSLACTNRIQNSRVTYKGPLIDTESKTREEFETDVENGASISAILERLGFTPTATVRKIRTKYRVDEILIALDDVAAVGLFVEIETAVENESDIPPARETAFEMLRRLGLDPENQIRTSYLGLVLENA